MAVIFDFNGRGRQEREEIDTKVASDNEKIGGGEGGGESTDHAVSSPLPAPSPHRRL